MNEQRDSSSELPPVQQPEQPEARDSQSALLCEHDALNAEWRQAASEMDRIVKESAAHSDHSEQRQQRLEEIHAKLGIIIQRQWEIECELLGIQRP